MADEVLTAEEAEAVAVLREYVAGDALIFTKSGPILALIDRLTAKVRAGENVIDAMEYRIEWLEDFPAVAEVLAEETATPCHVTALAAYRSVK